MDTHGVSLPITSTPAISLDTPGMSQQAQTRVATRHACPT